MKPRRLVRLLCLMQSLRRLASAILRHARAMWPGDVRRGHALEEVARIKADLGELREQTARMLSALQN